MTEQKYIWKLDTSKQYIKIDFIVLTIRFYYFNLVSF